jgi:hypothetical protein
LISAPPAGQTVTPQQRLIFAKEFGDRFRSKFGDAQVTTRGEAGKTLVIECLQISRRFAEQMIANKVAIQDLREMGFKRLILTDGNKSNWDSNFRGF